MSLRPSVSGSVDGHRAAAAHAADRDATGCRWTGIAAVDPGRRQSLCDVGFATVRTGDRSVSDLRLEIGSRDEPLLEGMAVGASQVEDNHVRLPRAQLSRSPSTYRMTLAGFPAATTRPGTSFVTTLPAPMVVSSPIVTPGPMTAAAPIQTFRPMVTG